MHPEQGGNPLIDAVLRQVTRLPLRLRRRTQQARLGQQQSRRRGAGMEFDQIKEYLYGDPVRSINWAATARRGSAMPLMNVYHEEQDFTVMLLVDLSASMDFGSTRLTKKTRAAEICASVAYSALLGHNRVGFLGVTSAVESYLPPGQTPGSERAIVERILAATSAATPVDFQLAVSVLERRVKPPALVFCLSDFLTDDIPGLARALTRLQRRYEGIALRLTDPLETTLPAGTARIVTRDLETNRVRAFSLTRKNHQRMAAQARMYEAQLDAVFQQCGVPHRTITPHSNYYHDLCSLFSSPPRRVIA
jgi:uncharacterized protein (DUF58 family)